jgi:hypothetical protein
MERMAAFADNTRKIAAEAVSTIAPERYTPEMISASYRVTDRIAVVVGEVTDGLSIYADGAKCVINNADIPALMQFLVWMSQKQEDNK